MHTSAFSILYSVQITLNNRYWHTSDERRSYRDVLFFGVAEAPNLIALDAARMNTADGGIVMGSTGFAEIAKQLQDGLLANASHPSNGTDAIPFHYHPGDLCPFLCAQAVHERVIMHDRSSIVKW
jgi:hypothetical protein